MNTKLHEDEDELLPSYPASLVQVAPLPEDEGDNSPFCILCLFSRRTNWLIFCLPFLRGLSNFISITAADSSRSSNLFSIVFLLDEWLQHGNHP